MRTRPKPEDWPLLLALALVALLLNTLGCRDLQEPPPLHIGDTIEETHTADDAEHPETSDIDQELDLQEDLSDQPDETDTKIDATDQSDLLDQNDQEEAEILLDLADQDTQDDDIEEGAFPPGDYEIEALLNHPDDALSSYLMSPSNGAWNIFTGDSIPLGRRPTSPHVSYFAALRFATINIPDGAEILSAALTWHATNSSDSSHQLCMNIYAELSSDSEPFDPTDYYSGRPDQRLHTGAFIDRWVVRCVSDCNPNIEYDCDQREKDCWNAGVAYTVPKDLKDIVQEIIDLPDWQVGNAMTLLIINSAGDSEWDLDRFNDSRSIRGSTNDHPEQAPSLKVRFRVNP